MKRVTYDEWRNMTTGERLEIIRGIYQLHGAGQGKELEPAEAAEGAAGESGKPRRAS